MSARKLPIKGVNLALEVEDALPQLAQDFLQKKRLVQADEAGIAPKGSAEPSGPTPLSALGAGFGPQAAVLVAGPGDSTVNGTSGDDLILLNTAGDKTATGDDGDDGFYFGSDYTSADTVDGGAGTLDQVGLQGNYGATTLGAMTGVEFLVIMSGSDTRFGDPGANFYDYNLTATDATVAAGELLIVQANVLRVGEDFGFDGTAESDGRFEVYSGDGNDVIRGGSGDDLIFGGGSGDTLMGGGGNDIFAYSRVTDSNSAERDGIQDFTLGDRIDLSRIDANINAGGNQDFTFIGTSAFSGTAGELRYESAGGPLYRLLGDVNGDGVDDLDIIYLLTDGHALTVDDFIGVDPAPVPILPAGKRHEEPQIMPAEAGATAPDKGRSTQSFTLPHDDRSLTIDLDGFRSFRPVGGEDDFVMSGDAVDQPLILPGQSDGVGFDQEWFGVERGLEFSWSGDMALTIAEDSPSFGGDGIDASGLYNWC